MKVEEIWRSWKAVQRMKNYIIFFSVKRQPFYRAYETDAEVLSYLFWFKIWQQWDTKYAWFPKESGKKYFSALKDAGYSFVVVHDVEWDGNRKAIAKNDWTKSLDISVSKDVFNQFKNELNLALTKYDWVNAWVQEQKEIPFKVFDWLLDDLDEILKKYKMSQNILSSNISWNIPDLDISNIDSNIDLL